MEIRSLALCFLIMIQPFLSHSGEIRQEDENSSVAIAPDDLEVISNLEILENFQLLKDFEVYKYMPFLEAKTNREEESE